jgi:hypothetical protein
LRRLGYDALGVGDNELVDGPDFLVEQLRDLPAVSASVRLTPYGADALWPSYRIVEKDGLRIAVIGLVTPESFRFMAPAYEKATQIQPMEETLRVLLPEARARADIIVALSHAMPDQHRDLARRFPDIDVIVGSHGSIVLEQPVREGNTVIVHPGRDGAYVGKLTLTLDRKKRIRDYSGRLIPLTETVSPDTEISRMVEAYHETLRRDAQRAAEQSAPTRLQGADACRPCHEPAYGQWRATPHAEAYHTLQEVGKQDNPECLSCHTTGYGQPGGYVDRDQTPYLADVQCEACHRLEENHDRRPPDQPPEKVDASVCVGCHTPSQSPDFHFEEHILHVRH